MDDSISRQAVLDYIDNMPSELTADGRRMIRRIRLTEYIQDSLPSAQPEPLTDKEQRIFLAAMAREEKICEEVDRNYVREPYEDSLMSVCREIKRKVCEAGLINYQATGDGNGMIHAVNVVKGLPSQPVIPQPEHKTGRWEITEAYPHNVYCSECHKKFAQTHWTVWEDGSLPRNYCPNCGARIVRGEEHDTGTADRLRPDDGALREGGLPGRGGGHYPDGTEG